jgi:hypothetical protein
VGKRMKRKFELINGMRKGRAPAILRQPIHEIWNVNLNVA